MLTRDDGKLDITRVSSLVDQLAWLRGHGHEVILVSSGAVASGRGELGYDPGLDSVEQRQLYSAVGQVKLVNTYYTLFREYGIKIGQVLTVKENFTSPREYSNLRACMEVMIENGVMPVVNENDSVSSAEIETGQCKVLGDNDTLSAMVARLCGADLLILLSDIDGLYDADPRTHPEARLIHHVAAITPELEAAAGGAGTWRGTGGMATKLHAAALCLDSGIDMVIANGGNMEAVYDIVAGRDVGTRFSRRG